MPATGKASGGTTMAGRALRARPAEAREDIGAVRGIKIGRKAATIIDLPLYPVMIPVGIIFACGFQRSSYLFVATWNCSFMIPVVSTSVFFSR